MVAPDDTTFEDEADVERLLMKKFPPELLQASESGLPEDLWLEQVRTAGEGENEDDGKLPASLTERALTEAIENLRQARWEEFADDDETESQ